ncbi:MAG TPA: hypothetical protein VG916_16005, partial [Gemmatimonadaceae bacterium]|nr:hypothetical protein [Gemmatimonadaceae bacterium]
MGHRLQGFFSFVGLVAVSGVLGYAAWKGLTKPPGGHAPARRAAPANDSLSFVSVAGEGVDLEIIGPTGARAMTTGSAAEGRIPGSETSVDCPGFTDPGAKEAACTASITVNTPAPGDYTVIARSPTPRALTVNVGWSTVSQLKRGGFDVRLQVAGGGATAFAVVVAR